MKRMVFSVVVFMAAVALLTVTALAQDKVLTVFANIYTPSDSMVVSPSNPTPINQLKLLAQEWEKLHKGVKVKFVKIGQGDYSTIFAPQVSGDVAPMVGHYLSEFWSTGKIVSLDKYLERPNPYIKGNQRWADAFASLHGTNIIEYGRRADNYIYSIPLDVVTTTVYYNKDIFAKVGVSIPKTWAELIDTGKKIKAAGYEPFGILYQGVYLYRWPQFVISDMLFRGVYEKDLEKEIRLSNRFVRPTLEEYTRAIKKGFILKDPRFRETYRLLKDFTEIWPDGWNTTDTEKLFLSGKLAMAWDGSWFYGPLSKDKYRNFAFGTLSLPPITTETSPYATGAPARMGGLPGNEWAISSSAVKAGMVDLAVDFLQFITTPRNSGRYVNELGSFLSSVKGAPVNKNLEEMYSTLDRGAFTEMAPPWLENMADEQVDRKTELFLLGRMSLDRLMSELTTWLNRGADMNVRKYRWNTSNW